MKMSKNKKKKQKVNKPQLSKLDKAIYYLLAALSLGICVGLLVLIEILKANMFFSDPNVLACQARLTGLWILPLLFVSFISLGAIWESTYGKRKAIFGNKEVDYTKHNYQFYPIFYKGEKPKRKMTPQRKKLLKTDIIIWITLFAIGLICFPFSILGRTTLTNDGQVVKYSVFNTEKDIYYLSDMSEIEYTSYRHNQVKGADYYTYAIKIYLKNSDKTFVFEAQDFDNTNEQSIFITSLNDMKYLRDSVYKDKKITYNIEEPLEKIIKDNNMTEEEIEKLYEFFNEI